VRRQPAEVGAGHALAEDVEIEMIDPRLRHGRQLVERAELVYQLERRRMDRVTAEVAEEVGMLLEHDHVDVRAREEPAGDHPGGAAADDAARRLERRHGRLLARPSNIAAAAAPSTNVDAAIAITPAAPSRAVIGATRSW